MALKVKVCGLNNPDNICQIAALEPDYIGFVFYSGSPRCALNCLDSKSLNGFSCAIKKTGVFVDAAISEIENAVALLNLDAVQLSGNESADYCKEIRSRLTGIEIIKALNGEIATRFEIAVYGEVTDLLLFDQRTGGYGGSGKKFDWECFSRQSIDRPFIISGGVEPADAEKLKIFSGRLSKLSAVDINSKFETSPGIKDVALVKEFIENIRGGGIN